MIELDKNRIIVQDVSELPNFSEARNIFLDGETTSGNDKEEAFHPYKGHRFCGIAVTADDDPRAWYIPIRHRGVDGKNIPIETAVKWLRDTLSPKQFGDRKRRWINHNVKFDAHFAICEGVDINSELELIDTLTLARTIDTDRISHRLKPLVRDWCGEIASEKDEIKAYLRGIKSDDYGRLPIDLCGNYACGDVQYNRMLWKYLQENVPEDLFSTWKTEIELTHVLLKMERNGLPVRRELIKREQVKSLHGMIKAADRINKLTGIEFSDSSKVAFEIIVGHFGLPIIAYTKDSNNRETSNPSFNGETLEAYLSHPDVIVNPKAAATIQLMLDYRQEETFKGLFLDAMLNLEGLDGKVHPFYNQIVRTGRMSCSGPNSQQFSTRAKKLITPDEDEAYLCADASQIEFRIMVDYTEDEDAIRAYQTDKKTDFHKWTANMCEIDRVLGKTINFTIGFGGGKKRTTTALAMHKNTIAAVKAVIGENPSREALLQALLERGTAIYNKYHEKFPRFKIVSEQAAQVCRMRGYVRNRYGRRRHLPTRFSYRSFNTAVQGTAMDYIKRRMIAIDKVCDQLNIRLLANVHDELLFAGPIDRIECPETRRIVTEVLETQDIPFKVPFMWESGLSRTSWAAAKP